VSVRDREEAVIARLHELTPHLDGEPDPAFRAATRARLVAMAAVRTAEPAPASGLRRLLARADDLTPSHWRSRLTAGLAGAAVAVTALAGLVAVSADALPGDALYGLKRGTEQTQLALASDASRGQTLLGFAGTRLDELEALVQDGASALPAAGASTAGGTTVLAAGPDPELILETIETMDDETSEGAAWLTDRAVRTDDQQPLDELAAWADEQSAGLAVLGPEMPAEARDAVANSLALLSDVAVRTAGLQEAVDCAYGPAVTGTDDLGPLPGLCLPGQTGGTAGGGGGTSSGGGGGSSDPGTGQVPGATTSGLPTVPPAGDAGTGSTGSTGLPTAGVPSVPTQGGGGGLPSLPTLPTTTLPTTTPSLPSVSLPATDLDGDAVIDAPQAPVTLCLPPLASIGDC